MILALKVLEVVSKFDPIQFEAIVHIWYVSLFIDLFYMF